MDNLTYETYRRNPAVREQLELEARDARRAEAQRLIVAPFMRCITQAFTNARLRLARSPRSLPSLQI